MGSHLVEMLQRMDLPPTVEVVDGGLLGLHLLNLVEGHEHVVIVDAARMGREPGEIARFSPHEVVLSSETDDFSVHHAGIAEAMALADALGKSLPTIVVFGVEPADVGWREGMSPLVEGALPRLIDQVLAELRRAVASSMSDEVS